MPIQAHLNIEWILVLNQLYNYFQNEGCTMLVLAHLNIGWILVLLELYIKRFCATHLNIEWILVLNQVYN